MAEGSDRNQQGLKEYELTNVEENVKIIGSGCYGVVVELRYHGLKCAGKKIHSILYDETHQAAKRATLQSIIRECKTLSKTRHPNIVQFIGVYYPAGSSLPTLVMEYLPTTLAKCLTNYNDLPEEISYTILEDVALALCYLHGNDIIHRDLSGNNVLLTSDMRAKISDLGVAKMLAITPAGKMTMTKQPGTIAYMPPEALRENPHYSKDIDIFSYGVLIVHVFCHECPVPGDKSQPDTNTTNGSRFVHLNEMQRRQKYLDRVGTNHPLYKLITECLDKAKERPIARTVLETVSQTKAELPIHHRDLMRTVERTEMLERKVIDYTAQQRVNTSRITELQSHNTHLERENDFHCSDKSSLECDLREKVQEIEQRDQELRMKSDQLQRKTGETEELKKKLLEKNSQMHEDLHRIEMERNQALLHLTSGNQFHLLHDKVKVKWENVGELPAAMTAPQCTLINSKLYAGGGQTDDDKMAERKQVFAFDTNDHSIEIMPQCPVTHFGLGNIGGKLVAVGGKNPVDKHLTNEVHVLDMNQQGFLEWKKGVIPSLSKPRARACIVSQTEDQNSTCIAACGGRIQNHEDNASSASIVEVYRKDSPRWDTVTPLPHPRAALRVTVLHNTAYLLGGFYDMKEASKPDCQSIILDSLFQENPRELRGWRVLKDMPSQSATPGHLCGTLLAVGGLMDGNEKPILAFNPNTQMWVHIANLPKTISSATAAALPNGRLIIFGGWTKVLKSRNREIFVGRVTGRMF